MSTQGHYERRLRQVESGLARLERLADLVARDEHREQWRSWRFAMTAKHPTLDTYPADDPQNPPNTFWLKFLDAEFSPPEQGISNVVKYDRSAKALVPARNLSGDWVAEGTVVIAFWSKVAGSAEGAHFFLAGQAVTAGGNAALLLFKVGATALERTTEKLTDAKCVWAEGTGSLPALDDTVEVWNPPSNATSVYWYKAAVGQYGLAQRVDAKWWILRMEPVIQSGVVVGISIDGSENYVNSIIDVGCDFTLNPDTTSWTQGILC